MLASEFVIAVGHIIDVRFGRLRWRTTGQNAERRQARRNMKPDACRVLLIYPRFVPNTFWNYQTACELFGVRYPAAPLSLITVAALLPQSWEFRLINRNTEELRDDDLRWADLVMTGGMINQQPDCLDLIERCHAHGKPVVVGGPDATSSPHIYSTADFLVLGEAETIIADFVEAWRRGDRAGVFTAEKFTIDVTKTPLPRFDLLKFDQYFYICVQYSRGCPFTCEFCDIIELYGRVPRTKTTKQMLEELEYLYQLGYRGHVDFVDDNLIGNKKSLKQFLPELKKWLEAHDYPFEFSTEASLNVADDDELLRMMKEANFFAIFVGIESPEPDALVATRKKQNTRRDIADSIHRIYAAGMFVTAGFIMGFDSESASIAGAMEQCIDDCAIPICMVGLLYALPNTQLTRRLVVEGRLHQGHDFVDPERAGDQCMFGINFDPARPMADILSDYRQVLERIYTPEAFARRLRRLCDLLDRSTSRRREPKGDIKWRLATTEHVERIANYLPEAAGDFRQALSYCASTNPRAFRFIVQMMAIYTHLGPFSRRVMAEIESRIAAEERSPTRQLEAAAAFVGRS
jgi:Domain of unknown function (DUF4070)/Radical SAM superfamily